MPPVVHSGEALEGASLRPKGATQVTDFPLIESAEKGIAVGRLSVGTQESPKNAPFRKGETVVLDGREYRFHRDCGEFVWLAAIDAGICGPFYWLRSSELTLASTSARAIHDSAAERKQRLKAAQTELATLPLNGPEYMAQLAIVPKALRAVRNV